MGGIIQLTQGLLDSTNAFNSVWRKQIEHEAEFSTNTKQIRLQNDINAELLKIRQSNNFEDWLTNINNLFSETEKGMSDPNSSYYCRNQIEGEMFSKILAEQHSKVNYQIAVMVAKKQSENRIAEAGKATQLLIENGATGQEFTSQANQLYKDLNDNGDIRDLQLEEVETEHKNKGYELSVNKYVDNSFEDAIRNNETFTSFKEKIKAKVDEENPEGISKEKESQIWSNVEKQWNEKLKDLQQNNADKLAEIVTQVRSAGNNVDKGRIARYGMNKVLEYNNTQLLSENDRIRYSSIFELYLKAAESNTDGSGTGNGSNKEVLDSYEKVVKVAPSVALQMVRENIGISPYEAAQAMSKRLQDEWLYVDWKENEKLGYNERNNKYFNLYSGDTSEESLTNEMLKQIMQSRPEVMELWNNNFKGLRDDMKKNPKLYGGASLEALANFLVDLTLESHVGIPTEQIMNTFKKYINDCYIESINYMEFEKKKPGVLKATYDVTKPDQVAKAANLVHEKDYVYTYAGNEVWAPGKKEALEAEGGINSVLRNAAARTLGLSPEDLQDTIYKRTRNDMESVPIFKHGDKAYEVVATENGKSFNVIEYGYKKEKDEDGNEFVVYDEDGLPVFDFSSGEIINGVVPDKKAAKEERKAAKQEAKMNAKTASAETATLKKQREEENKKKITQSNSMPYAMIKAGKVEQGEWENYNNTNRTEERQYMLNVTANKINSEAKDISKIKDEDEKELEKNKFYEKYHINYDDWMENRTEEARHKLILKSVQ